MSTRLDVVANNLANINTTGFKAFRANLEDLAYQERAQPGVENVLGDPSPAGLYVGLGTRISNTQQDFRQGAPVPTDRPLDLTIDGNGFFMVAINPEIGDGVGYTRSGNLFRNADGDLVLGNSTGPRLEPPINIPTDVDISEISISAEGIVSYIEVGSDTESQAGQIQLANFVNPPGLQAIGGNILVPTPASGPAIEGNPGEDSLGNIQQGVLEGSNVDPVLELVDLIKTQRAFEFNSQSIQAADEALTQLANLRR